MNNETKPATTTKLKSSYCLFVCFCFVLGVLGVFVCLSVCYSVHFPSLFIVVVVVVVVMRLKTI